MHQIRTKHIGAILGLALGISIAHYGFIITVFLAAMATLGWTLGRAVDGEIDLGELIRRRGGEDVD